MSSKKNHSRQRRTRKKSSAPSSRRRQCKGGRKSSSRNKRRGEKKNKWSQKGCQSGGGGVTGGWPWGTSDVHPQSSGSSSAQVVVPHSINGNHYALNNDTMERAQSSNHLVELGQFGGSNKRRHSRRRYVGEQNGGMAQYLPEVMNTNARYLAEIPANAANSIQGAATAFRTSDPTIQPIGQSIQLL